MICNNCGDIFTHPDTVREPMDDDFNGQRSFIGYQVCPECHSSNIEETDRCICGEIKRKSLDYCEHCTEITSKIVQSAISEILEFIPTISKRTDAREMLREYVEENL